jgi:hypothetical protein
MSAKFLSVRWIKKGGAYRDHRDGDDHAQYHLADRRMRALKVRDQRETEARE